jgi:hypothetical protein
LENGFCQQAQLSACRHFVQLSARRHAVRMMYALR